MVSERGIVISIYARRDEARSPHSAERERERDKDVLAVAAFLAAYKVSNKNWTGNPTCTVYYINICVCVCVLVYLCVYGVHCLPGESGITLEGCHSQIRHLRDICMH